MAESEREKNEKIDFTPRGYHRFVENTPCVRDSFMYGVSSGLGIGFTKYIFSKHIRKSCDAAVLSFAVVSLISWQTCRYYKKKRNDQMKQTVEMLNQISKKPGETDNELSRT